MLQLLNQVHSLVLYCSQYYPRILVLIVHLYVIKGYYTVFELVALPFKLPKEICEDIVPDIVPNREFLYSTLSKLPNPAVGQDLDLQITSHLKGYRLTSSRIYTIYIHIPYLPYTFKPIFHCDANPFAFGPRVGLSLYSPGN